MSSQRSWQGLDLRGCRRSRCLLIFVLLALPLSATTYYVDNCVVTGSDSNHGTSTAAPWLTINKVNTSSFSPGDSILFNRGCTWREQLTVPSSGKAGNPITFGAYGAYATAGSTSNPILTPSTLVTGWTFYRGAIYQASFATTAYSVWEDSVYLAPESSLANVTAAGEWFETGGVLYVWASAGDSPSSHVMEAANTTTTAQSAISITSQSYINIQNLTVEKNSGNANLGIISGITSSYVTMSNLIVAYSGYQGYGVYFNTNGSHNTLQNSVIHDIRDTCVYFANGVSYTAVQQNTIYNCGQNTDVGDNGGLTLGGGTSPASNSIVTQNLIYDVGSVTDTNSANGAILIDRGCQTCSVTYNAVHDSANGGIMVTGYVGNHAVGLTISYNVVYNINARSNSAQTGNRPGIGISNVDNVVISNNTTWNVGTSDYAADSILITGTSTETLNSTTVKNNILGPSLGSAHRRNYHTRSNATFTNFVSDYNLFYDSAGLVLYDGDNNYSTHASFVSATGLDTHSLNSNPNFTDVSAYNFTLSSSSPAIDAGTNLGSTYQLGLDPASSWPSSIKTDNQNSNGTGWEIGAFVFLQQAPPAPPTSLSATVK